MSRDERRLVVASTDRLFAETAAEYISDRYGWRIAGIASDGMQALDLARRSVPSVVLIIGDLTRVSALAVAEEISRRIPDTAIVTVGTVIGATLPAEADGPTIARMLEDAQPFVRPLSDQKDAERKRLRTLTPRERRILRLMTQGESVAGIASTLNVSQNTARTHVQNLYSKLGVHRRIDLVRFAARHGLDAVGTARSR